MHLSIFFLCLCVIWLLNEFVFFPWSIWHVAWRRFVTVVVFEVAFCYHIVCISYYAYSLNFCCWSCFQVFIWLELLMIAKKHWRLEFGLWTCSLTRCVKSLATLKWSWWMEMYIVIYLLLCLIMSILLFFNFFSHILSFFLSHFSYHFLRRPLSRVPLFSTLYSFSFVTNIALKYL